MNRKYMRGVYVVEFAIIGSLLFVLLLGILEFGRLYFTVNAMEEVVRRGARLAAVCDIHDEVVLHRALFNGAGDSGSSALIANLQPSDLHLVYFDKNGGIVPDPNDVDSTAGFRAIRFVRLSVENFPFNFLIPSGVLKLLNKDSNFDGAITLPAFRSTQPRESLGRHAESGKLYDDPPGSGITPC